MKRKPPLNASKHKFFLLVGKMDHDALPGVGADERRNQIAILSPLPTEILRMCQK